MSSRVSPHPGRPFDARPVLPRWVVERDERRAAARWAAAYVGHTTAFHGVRTPVYVARVVAYSPRGAGRALAAVCRWVADTEAAPLRAQLVDAGDHAGYLALVRHRNDRVRRRLIVAAVSGALVAITVTVVSVVAPWAVWPMAGAAVAVAGVAGRPKDRPLLESAVTLSGPAPRLTADVVIRALGSLGIAEINRALAKGEGITFAGPITRDGPGWRADVDLPYGVTAADIIERRDRVASGLRRPIGCVWPEPVDDAHAGRLVLWVGDRDLSKTPAPAWPLADRGAADFFAPVVFGTDPRGRPVDVVLFENNALVGALPGAGKTATVRVLLLAAALDPTCELWVFNLKNNDLDAAEHVATRYAYGLGDDAALVALQALRDLRDELTRRSAVLSRLPRRAAPDGKVTRELANRRELGLHPLVCIVDECQNLFSHSEYGGEAGELAEHIIRLGRALAVTLILATQRPDRDSLPKGVSANVSVRFCLRVTGQVENDMVLGTGAHKAGIRATTLRPSDRGIGYLVGAHDEPMVVRSAYVDREAADRIAQRARAARLAAGTLTGYAAGERDTGHAEPGRDLLDDLAEVLGAEDKAHSDVLCARLAEHWPDRYTDWTPATLAAALRPHGITTRQVWAPCVDGKPANHNGITTADLAGRG